MICLARAILQKNKILVLDEATANVDIDTDSLIQETIKEKFAKCTVLTVAHRLDTIIASDKILVMSHGRAIEYDHPHILLEDEKSEFGRMVAASGKIKAEALRSAALSAYEKV